MTKVPAGRNIIGARWVLARKDNGHCQAQWVARGFSQIPGKAFQQNHAPVILVTTLHLRIFIRTILQLEAGQFNIETTFIYEKLKEDLWMLFPEGYQDYVKEKLNEDIDPKTQYLYLTRAIYGLVQATKQFGKIFKGGLSCIGYFPSKADPCLIIGNAYGQKSYLIIYVYEEGTSAKRRQR
jgi:hypothetical protein